MKVLLTAFLTFLCVGAFGQIAFYKGFSNLGDDFGQGVIELPDTSYLITGSSSSFTNNMEVFLLKIDSVGNKLWSTHFGGIESDLGRKVISTPNGDIFLCGYTNSFGTGDFDFYLLKVDADGNLIWEKNYGTGDWEKVNDAVPTSDNGVLLVGERNGAEASSVASCVVRVDNNGDTLWTKTFGSNSKAYSVNTYRDSMYVVLGSIYLSDSLQNKGLLTVLDDNGTIVAQDTIGPNGHYFLKDAIVMNDSIQIVGKSYPMEGDDNRLLRITYNLATNTTLDLISLQGVGSWSGELITLYGDSTFRYLSYQIVASFTTDLGPDLHFGRYDAYLNSIASVVQLEYTGEEMGRDLIATRDGGAISVGYTTVGGSGSGNVYVLKIGPGETYPDTQGGTLFEPIVDLVEINKNVGFKYYPNPAENLLYVEPNELTIQKMLLTDLSGKEVLQTAESPIQMGSVSTGIYLLNIQFENGQSESVKVIKR